MRLKNEESKLITSEVNSRPRKTFKFTQDLYVAENRDYYFSFIGSIDGLIKSLEDSGFLYKIPEGTIFTEEYSIYTSNPFYQLENGKHLYIEEILPFIEEVK